MTQKYRIYLDVCCLNRPLDDFSQDRVRLEAEAVLLIYRKCRIGEWALISSTALQAEILKTPNVQRREQVILALSIAQVQVTLDDTIKRRATDLVSFGFKPFDAVHIASAEMGQADVMLTTDDRLLRRATRYQDRLNISIENPAIWLLAINQVVGESDNDDSN
jgi:hypothetical protein